MEGVNFVGFWWLNLLIVCGNKWGNVIFLFFGVLYVFNGVDLYFFNDKWGILLFNKVWILMCGII